MTESKFNISTSEVVDINNKSVQKTVTIEREINKAPDDTHWGAARQIEDVPAEGQDGMTRLQVIEAIVKRYGHHAKLGAYQRADLYLDKPDAFPFVKGTLKIKIETHTEFSQRPLNMQIYGQGAWKKD